MKPRRSPAYLAYLRRQPCALCSSTPCDPHHVRIRGTTALGRKVSDYQGVPLCREHHNEVEDKPVDPERRAILAERALVLLVAWVEGRRG